MISTRRRASRSAGGAVRALQHREFVAAEPRDGVVLADAFAAAAPATQHSNLSPIG